MTPDSLLLLMALLLLKHFVADGPLQSDSQATKKGVWLHPAGLSHVGVHAAGTGVALTLWALATGAPATPSLLGAAAALLLVEAVVHYLIDYGKSQIDGRLRFATSDVDPDGRRFLRITHPRGFFALLLADQALHGLTYVGVVLAVSWM